MKEHCVDLEIAKELKENGFPQTSFCSYDLMENFWHGCIEDFSAPTSDEILKELPKQILDWYSLKIHRNILGEYCVYYKNRFGMLGDSRSEYKLADALAKLWLYLKKVGYIK